MYTTILFTEHPNCKSTLPVCTDHSNPITISFSFEKNIARILAFNTLSHSPTPLIFNTFQSSPKGSVYLQKTGINKRTTRQLNISEN